MISTPGIVLPGASEWNVVYSKPNRKIEYLVRIGGVDYGASDLAESPILEHPLLEGPAIGQCATGTATLKIFPKGSIGKAAPVDVYCRIVAGGLFTSWYDLGHYSISTRVQSGPVLALTCKDGMIKAGRTWIDKTSFTSWPVNMRSAVAEICTLCGLELDSRSEIRDENLVDYPNELLMSEVLAMIGAAHGANWIITQQGKLRMVSFPDTATQAAVENIGHHFTDYTAYSLSTRTISRLTLQDGSHNEFSVGDDTGIEVGSVCTFATMAVATAAYNTIDGAQYRPYSVSCAYISPLVEVGDIITLKRRNGEEIACALGYMKRQCNRGCISAVSFGSQEDAEEEYPYVSPADLRAARTVSTLQSYYGNRINREEGFVSERVVNNDVKARMVANADLFTMQQKDSNNQWKNRIYFDATAGKYVIDGDVTITALQEINEEIEDMGGGASNLYEWIRDGQYKMTSSEFNIMMKADADYTRFYDDMCVGTGSVKYKADYIYSAEGFNATLEANNKFNALYSDVEGTGAQDTSSIKYKANYVASANGFNAMLQANSDYSLAKTTISATAEGLLSKVEKSGIISAINQSAESVTIDASKINLSGATIDLTGKTSINNKVVIGNDGVLTADSATITNASITGTLKNGQWTFNGTGSEYKKGGIGCTVSMLTGGAGMAGGGSDYRAFYGSSGCDVQYGSDYFYQTIIRGRNIKIISQVDGASDFRSAEFKKIAGANDMTFVCGESTGQGSESGNLGCSDQPWDTLWCRKQHRGESDSTYSSREIKKDIHDMPEMGVVLDQLNPVTFRYTWDKDDASLKHGLIYEDTVTVFPDICEAPDPTGKHGAPYGSIMYEELITVLLKETQSLRRRVKELEDVA